LRLAVEVDMETSDREFGNECKIVVKAAKLSGKHNLWGNLLKLGIGLSELSLEVHCRVEDEYRLIDLNPFNTGLLELRQELDIDREKFLEERNSLEVRRGIPGGLTQDEIGNWTKNNGTSLEASLLGLGVLCKSLVEVKVKFDSF